MSNQPPSPSHTRITWVLLFLLLFLRIPFTILIIYFLPIEDLSGSTLYEVGTYLLLAALIWHERGRLAEFHMDGPALLFFIALRPIPTLILQAWHVDSPLAFPRPMGLALWLIAIGLGIALRRGRAKTDKVTTGNLGWLAAGLTVGAVFSILENLDSFQAILNSPYPAPTSALTSVGMNVLYHLGFAPINEEPLFRGFLWGALRDRNWKTHWILFFQVVLFTSAHVYFASQNPLAFWVTIPLAALALGLLTMRSKSVAPAILAHGMINGSVYLLLAQIL